MNAPPARPHTGTEMESIHESAALFSSAFVALVNASLQLDYFTTLFSLFRDREGARRGHK